jgi:hypothetical protein
MNQQGVNGMSEGSVIVVSGLPRSGTSMMMRMLEAGGVPVLTDRIRGPDEDNPRGYYEFERVKQIEHDQAWLADARGSAVKMIAALLRHLPPEHAYKTIFMERSMDEILASQRRMLERRGEQTDRVGDAGMAEAFSGHLERVKAWLSRQPNFQVFYVQYSDVLAAPARQADRIARFLGVKLEVDRMAAVVDLDLYRQRR